MYENVFVRGRGFLGKNLIDKLEELKYRVTNNYTNTVNINMSGLVGGIGMNRDRPAEMFYENSKLCNDMLSSSSMLTGSKYIGMHCGCVYPDGITEPMKEHMLHEGLPEANVTPFAMAKRANIVMAQAYRKQYGFNAISLIGGNCYGEHDYFDEEHAHVIPSMIMKFHKAKENNDNVVTLWGSGHPIRDFIFAEDMAEGIIQAMEKYDKPEPLNIASGKPITVRKLAETIREIVDYEGKILWDKSKPDGQEVKTFCTERMKKELDWEPKVGLREGLEKTWRWYCENKTSDEA